MRRPVEPMPMDHHMRVSVTAALRTYILANNAARAHPAGWRACRPNPETEEGRTYQRLSDASQEASSRLWMATDFEFEPDGFRDVVWEWRYWKVMARKCCWYQMVPLQGFMAAKTMRKLHEAEARMVEVCGLTEIYRSACSFIEEQFPELKKGVSGTEPK